MPRLILILLLVLFAPIAPATASATSHGGRYTCSELMQAPIQNTTITLTQVNAATADLFATRVVATLTALQISPVGNRASGILTIATTWMIETV